MIELSEEQMGLLQFSQQGDWMVFKIMIAVAAGMILADYFIGIKEKKRMGFFDIIFVTFFLPLVLVTLTWPVSKPIVLSLVSQALGY
ncbi:MAG: hypothetical protein HKP40_04390 [Litoreibacter sp.]|nr:hypothetical protein [Litoreibacter sp.]